MSVPRFDEIMLPLLEYLKDQNVHSIQSTNEYLKQYFKLENLEEITVSQGTKSIFDRRCEWARFYLKKADLTEKPTRKFIKISQSGIQFLKTNPKSINKKTLLEIPQFSKFYKKTEYIARKKKNLKSN